MVVIQQRKDIDEVLDMLICDSLSPVQRDAERERLMHVLAGSTYHFPKSWRLQRRNKEIAAKFCGNNWKELCIEYRICRAHLYTVVKRQRLFSHNPA
jgi:Mor family transcriptional regulator